MQAVTHDISQLLVMARRKPKPNLAETLNQPGVKGFSKFLNLLI